MIQITIADDHPLLREGVKKVLAKESDIELITEASDGKILMNELKKKLPDILVLDMSMPGQSGLALIKSIHHLYPQLPILVLSMHPAEQYAVRALKAGARGYLNKASILDDLARAIRKLAIGNQRYITDEVAGQLARQIDQENGRPLYKELSDREFEVLCMIAEGRDVKDIAKKLSISTHTVHTYRSRIKDKMNLASNVEMTRYAIENDLID